MRTNLQNPSVFKAFFLIALIFVLNPFNTKAQGVWTAKANYPDVSSRSVAFSIGNKGYIGLGYQDSTNFFWEFDPSLNTWTRISDFPGSARVRGSAFSIGTKGYVTTGSNLGGPGFCNDLWEYDQLTDVWTQKADPPFNPRTYATGFAIGNKGYIGTGDTTDSGSGAVDYVRDFWEYDPASDSWIQIPDFPGVGKAPAVGFSIGNKGYFGTGNQEISDMASSDFWEYDPASQEWTPKADLPTPKCGATGFSVLGKGYIGTGVTTSAYTNDFYEYDPGNDLWTRVADLTGPTRKHAVAFTIGSKGYAGTGNYDDFYEFDPTAVGINELTIVGKIRIAPNPGHGAFTLVSEQEESQLIICNVLGETISEIRLNFGNNSLDLSEFAAGLYSCVQMKGAAIVAREKLIIQ
ncbi:MAG: hypothetical protein M3R27_07280 [Bacteroidota bacterium]|nr:hypothetical protein [Bacteroidota bacterium]